MISYVALSIAALMYSTNIAGSILLEEIQPLSPIPGASRKDELDCEASLKGKRCSGKGIALWLGPVERIEFASGEAAVRASQARDDLLSQAASVLRVPNERLPRTAERFFEEWKSQQKEIERLKEDLAEARLKTVVAEAETIGGLRMIVQKMGNADIDELLKAAALLAEEDCVALLGSKSGKLVAAVGRSGLEKGIKAGSIIKAAAKLLGGGGRPELVQGGGPDTERLEEALAAGREAMRAGA